MDSLTGDVQHFRCIVEIQQRVHFHRIKGGAEHGIGLKLHGFDDGCNGILSCNIGLKADFFFGGVRIDGEQKHPVIENQHRTADAAAFLACKCANQIGFISGDFIIHIQN